mmetsp:Transcript_26101/g.63400  ORF Transcript_26101/g.63400 Transcript_26101/m.63400 type:complete len:348 (+) Transcript_26101:18-1061(+)
MLPRPTFPVFCPPAGRSVQEGSTHWPAGRVVAPRPTTGRPATRARRQRRLVQLFARHADGGHAAGAAFGQRDAERVERAAVRGDGEHAAARAVGVGDGDGGGGAADGRRPRRVRAGDELELRAVFEADELDGGGVHAALEQHEVRAVGGGRRVHERVGARVEAVGLGGARHHDAAGVLGHGTERAARRRHVVRLERRQRCVGGAHVRQALEAVLGQPRRLLHANETLVELAHVDATHGAERRAPRMQRRRRALAHIDRARVVVIVVAARAIPTSTATITACAAAPAAAAAARMDDDDAGSGSGSSDSSSSSSSGISSSSSSCSSSSRDTRRAVFHQKASSLNNGVDT